MQSLFYDRHEAGTELARSLEPYAAQEDAIVLALPRGGVPVAYEVAIALGLPLDVILVRKLGVPYQPELAMGAIARGGVAIIDERLIQNLGISEYEVAQIADAERFELERREKAYRGEAKPPDLCGKIVILVDDGLATGSSMKAAIMAARRLAAARVVVAVPVAPQQTVGEMQRLADDVICLMTPAPFRSVGQWYTDFGQVEDADVTDLLARAKKNVDKIHRRISIDESWSDAARDEADVTSNENAA